jgi:hypothetical protein
MKQRFIETGHLKDGKELITTRPLGPAGGAGSEADIAESALN